jgi:hypothetical protein
MTDKAESLYLLLVSKRDAAKLAFQPWGMRESVAVIREFLAGYEVEIRGAAKKERKKASILPDAEQVYALYPKKVGKEDALRAISNALKKNALPYLLDKTNQFKECVESWPSSYRYFTDGGDRCPHPATWFNAGRYADDPREWKRHGARTGAAHQKISLPEPEGWRDAFPEYVNRDRPWAALPSEDQRFISETMKTTAALTHPVDMIEQEMRLRHA